MRLRRAVAEDTVFLLKNVKQIAMVIATGNTAVLMPSEFATQVTVQFARTLHEAGLPGGVFNYVTGDPAEIGDFLTSHNDIAAINFCGSPRIFLIPFLVPLQIIIIILLIK